MDVNDWVVEVGKDEDVSDDLIWDFDDDVGDDEGNLRVGFVWLFMYFIEFVLGDEKWLDL